MEPIIKKWGGKRPGSGAKKKNVLDKKHQVQLYIPGRIYSKFGLDELKNKIYEYLETL